MKAANTVTRAHFLPPDVAYIVTAIRQLDDHRDNLPADDLAKLNMVADRLQQFSQNLTATLTDQQKFWHDLRNLISTAMGYCKLMLEDISDNQCAANKALQQVLSHCQQLLDQSHQQPSPTLPPQLTPSISGTILIVDDQSESREILSRHLQQNQHQVLHAADGKQMFSILGSNTVDVILLDLILPEMDGDALLQQLRTDEKLRATPVIVVSGNRNTARIIRCIEAGADDYMFKPFNPDLLQARISAGIERKRWHDKEQLYREELERNQQFIRSVFGRYLSEEIVATLLENPDGLDLGGVQRKVSVLMADIRGFTTIAEQLPAQRVVRLLNNYLGTMSDIIMKYNGTVDEFIGDAILAIFGAPISRIDDTSRAVCCALEMQAAMEGINQRNREQGLPEISIGISINTGPVIAGNIGSEKRAKYGVVGHTVNQTARIEEHCKPGCILISQATLRDCDSLLSISEHKIIKTKGILKSIKVYQLAAMSPRSVDKIKQDLKAAHHRKSSKSPSS